MKLEIEDCHLNIKTIYEYVKNSQLTSYSMVKWKALFLKSWTKQECLFLPFICSTVLGVLARTIRQEKKIKVIQIVKKKEVKLSLFIEDSLPCKKIPRFLYKTCTNKWTSKWIQ